MAEASSQESRRAITNVHFIKLATELSDTTSNNLIATIWGKIAQLASRKSAEPKIQTEILDKYLEHKAIPANALELKRINSELIIHFFRLRNEPVIVGFFQAYYELQYNPDLTNKEIVEHWLNIVKHLGSKLINRQHARSLEQFFERYPGNDTLDLSNFWGEAAASDPNVSIQLLLIFTSLINTKHIKKLILSGNFFSLKQLTIIRDYLLQNHHVTAIDLSNCRVGADGATILAQIIDPDITSLRHCNISHNAFGDPGLSNFINLVAFNTQLESLHLQGCGITDNGATYLLGTLQNNNYLKELALDGNQISEAKAKLIAARLAQIKRIRSNPDDHKELDRSIKAKESIVMAQEPSLAGMSDFERNIERISATAKDDPIIAKQLLEEYLATAQAEGQSEGYLQALRILISQHEQIIHLTGQQDAGFAASPQPAASAAPSSSAAPPVAQPAASAAPSSSTAPATESDLLQPAPGFTPAHSATKGKSDKQESPGGDDVLPGLDGEFQRNLQRNAEDKCTIS